MISILSREASTKYTNQKHNIAFHKASSRGVLEGPITQDTAGRRNHGEERRKDSLRLLQLVELDECVEKSDCDEDATEIGVLYVTLGSNVSRCKR